jgi:hypothetical protein
MCSCNFSARLHGQLTAAIAKQTEHYSQILRLNEAYNQEAQRRQKAEREVTRLQRSEADCKAQMTEALKQLGLLEEQLLKLKRRVTRQQGLEVLIKSNQKLGADLQALLNQVNTSTCSHTALLPERSRLIRDSRESDLQTLHRQATSLDRQVLNPQLQTAITQAWLDLAEMMGCEAADASQKLSSNDSEVFLTGVLRAFQLVAVRGKPQLTLLHKTNLLETSLTSEPTSPELARGKGPIAWSTQPSTTTSVRHQTHVFESHYQSGPNSPAHSQSTTALTLKPQLADDAKALLEAILAQRDKLRALSDQLTYAISK